MSKTAPVVNYTPEMTKAVIEAYAAGTTVVDIAAQFSKTSRSIIAKLSREGVYKKAEYVSKTGEKPVAKETLADAIGARLSLSENDTSSLAKANKTALAAVHAFIEAHSAE